MPGMAATRRLPLPRTAKPAPLKGTSGRAAVPSDAVFTIDEVAIDLKLPKRTLYRWLPSLAFSVRRVADR